MALEYVHIGDAEAHIDILLAAALALLNDIRDRYPDQEFRCPHVRALDEAVNKVLFPLAK